MQEYVKSHYASAVLVKSKDAYMRSNKTLFDSEIRENGIKYPLRGVFMNLVYAQIWPQMVSCSCLQYLTLFAQLLFD